MTSTIKSFYLRQAISGEGVFFWPVYEEKFRITHRAGRLLSPSKHGDTADLDSRPPFIVCAGKRKRYYAPLRSVPVLHRRFCLIEDGRAMVDFASRYGLLGFTAERVKYSRKGLPPAFLLAESTARWQFELNEMRRLIYLWDLVREGKDSTIASLICREDDGLYLKLDKPSQLIAAADSRLYRKWQLLGGRPREAASHYIIDRINERIGGYVRPQINPEHAGRIYLHPIRLLDAMWLMFMWEVMGEVRPVRCPICLEWFDSERSTRKTCSDRCRQRLSRLKRKSSRGKG